MELESRVAFFLAHHEDPLSRFYEVLIYQTPILLSFSKITSYSPQCLVSKALSV